MSEKPSNKENPTQRRTIPCPCRAPSPLPSASPESQGINSGHILGYFRRLSREPSLKMQTVTVACGGKKIACGEFFPYCTDLMHVSHSLCKSLSGLGFGLLFDDGAADAEMPLCDVFSSNALRIGKYCRDLRMKHLLTMSAGARFNEKGSVTSTYWISDYFRHGCKFRPGSAFEYNSMNTYMLSAAIKRLSGRSLFDLLDERIFKPLGITEIFWEKCPAGVEKGGWGLYFYPDDMLKIGQLYLNGGVWEGRRLISEEWIRESTKKQITAPKRDGEFDYGYQIWCKDDGTEFLFNGMYGQNLMVFPKTGLMIMTTAGSDELFQNSQLYKITDKYFGGDFKPCAKAEENEYAYKLLRREEKRLFMSNTDAETVLKARTAPDKTKLNRFEGGFSVRRKDGFGISVMPELYQCVHNNFASGLSSLSLSFGGDGGVIKTVEGENEYEIPFGFTGAVPSCIRHGGEDILTSAYAVYKGGSDPYLRVTVCFPELPNIRYITFKPAGSGLRVKWEESPGYGFLSDLMNGFIIENTKGPVGGAIRRVTSSGFIKKRMKYFLAPELTAFRTGRV